MRSVYVHSAAVHTGYTLPLPLPTLRPPTTREFGNVDTVLAGVESSAKSSQSNLLKISIRLSNIVFSGMRREKGRERKERLDLIVPHERRNHVIDRKLCMSDDVYFQTKRIRITDQQPKLTD